MKNRRAVYRARIRYTGGKRFKRDHVWIIDQLVSIFDRIQDRVITDLRKDGIIMDFHIEEKP